MSHTPGPWTMRGDGIIQAESRTERKAIGQFTGIASEQKHVDEHSGNCRLIAAAPELLEALKSIRKWLLDTKPIEDDGQFWHPAFVKANNAAHAAIAKAEGKS